MKRERFWEIDALRGIAIIMMVAFHAVFDMAFFLGFRVTTDTAFWYFFPRIIASVFLLLVGVSLTISYRRASLWGASPLRKFLLRGAKIFSLGLAITAFTMLAFPQEPILFGVLHFIGLAIIICYPLLRHPAAVPPIAALLFAAGLFLNTITVQFPYLFWLGLAPAGFQTLDYFPLLPWLGVALAGVALGNRLYKEGKRGFHLQDHSKNIAVRPLAFLGRHSLLVYFLHQPLLVALLLLI